MNVLEEMWTSRANAMQRKGRAGRVRSGICYHLVSKYTMDHLAPYTVPEMLKMSLEDIILQVGGRVLRVLLHER
jgi:HrpA-like RNA helicase